MIKSEFIELASGKGDAEVYFCIPGNGANIGKFWDFTGLAWVTPITANCKVFATEQNSDGTVSIYRADITVPSGGPYLIYCYLQSTGKLQGQDITTEDEILVDTGTTLPGQIGSPLQSDDARISNLDATVSSRSTLTAQQVWEYATRTLTSFGTLIVDVWGYTTRKLTSRNISVGDDIAKEQTLSRVLGLAMENHVEDDIVRNASGLKTSSIIYLYDSGANATTHDKATGLVASYTVSVTYSGTTMTRIKVVKN